jgi:multimeric flavodoxin WrbA
MTGERVAVLDGTSGVDAAENEVAAALSDVIRRAGCTAEVFTLRDERVSHCIGCFGCWLETPGLCRSADRGRDVVAALVRADTVVLLTPVTFGGYSATLKRAVDRWVPTLLPFFVAVHGELHHPLRYGRFPRLVAVGIQTSPNGPEAELFRALVARNALNFRAPSHAAEIVAAGWTELGLRERLGAALVRRDPAPSLESIRALVGDSARPAPAGAPTGERRALVLVGSPKTRKPSTSGVLGRHVLAGLEARGWQGDVLALTAAIRDAAWRERMLAAVAGADLLLLAFPLYIDALPALLTRTLELIAERRRHARPRRAQRLAVVVNSGFPEASQNLPALAICARFAAATGITWAGGLAMGAGEALSSGVPLTGPTTGVRPPVGHVIAALDLAAAELAAGRPVPAKAVALIAQNPLPLVPFPIWRRFFAYMGGRSWRQQAAANGLGRVDMLARPFAGAGPDAVSAAL